MAIELKQRLSLFKKLYFMCLHFHRYIYSHFGTKREVKLPPNPLVLGDEYHFSDALSVFKFTTCKNTLVEQLLRNPLSLELLVSGKHHDTLVGVSKVCVCLLVGGEVFNFLYDRTVVYLCSLQV